jgi:hypothetical protein
MLAASLKPKDTALAKYELMEICNIENINN